jgi:hypothetical protein
MVSKSHVCLAGGVEPSEQLRDLVEGCKSRHPTLVAEVLVMMEELERITILWEEQWHTTLLEVEVWCSTFKLPTTVQVGRVFSLLPCGSHSIHAAIMPSLQDNSHL